MIEAGKAAAEQRQPSPAEQKDVSVAQLNQAKTQQIQVQLSGEDPETQLNYMAMAMGKAQDYGHW